MENTCAVVITYNPYLATIYNINLLSRAVSHVVVIDNGSSTRLQKDLLSLKQIENVSLIFNPTNLGIGAALNIGVEYAINHGYQWVATFDQDSTIDNSYFNEIFHTYYSCNKTDQIALICPIIKDAQSGRIIKRREFKNKPFNYIMTAITSGSVIKTSVFKDVGFFDDKLFIDYVDHEFCLRILKSKYIIIQSCKATLSHSLGNLSKHSILGFQIFSSHHSYTRKYYISRNRIHVYKRYFKHFPLWVVNDLRKALSEVLKIVMFEDKKILKLTYINKGVIHGLLGITGPLQSEERQIK